MVYNPNEYYVQAYFTYKVEGHTAGEYEYGLKIDPSSYGKVQKICYDETLNECYIDQNTVEYHIVKPELLYPCEQNVTITITVCKKCGDSICLDDSESCSKDKECGSKICNIAGFCGKVKNVSCPDGTKFCNDDCVKPSIKKVGEAFMCKWECETGIGQNGICKEKISTKIKNFLLTSGLLVLIALAIVYYYKKSLGKEEQEKKSAEIEELNKEHEKIKEKIRNEQEKLKNEIANKEKLKEKLDKLKKEEAEKKDKLKEEKEKYKKERLTPFTNKQGSKVHINENGYEVLAKSGTLFHRWWFENKHNRKIKQGYEIHHKSFNKRDNRIENLQEISVEEHKRLHWDRYKQ